MSFDPKHLKIGKKLIPIDVREIASEDKLILLDNISMEECHQIHDAVQDLLCKHSEYEVFKAIAAYSEVQGNIQELAPTTREMAARLNTELMTLIQRMAIYQHELLADEE